MIISRRFLISVLAKPIDESGLGTGDIKLDKLRLPNNTGYVKKEIGLNKDIL